MGREICVPSNMGRVSRNMLLTSINEAKEKGIKHLNPKNIKTEWSMLSHKKHKQFNLKIPT